MADPSILIDRQTEKQIDRIAFFSDAVFAIALTLLILDLRSPAETAAANVPHELVRLWPAYLSFLLSFIVIGLYWNSHHRLFGLIRGYDRGLIWLNLALLLCIVVLPFPTSLIGQHQVADVSYIVYAAWVALTATAAGCLTWHAVGNHRLVDAALDGRFLRFLVARSWSAAAFFVASIPLVFVSHRLAQLLWYASLFAPRLLRRHYGVRGSIDSPDAGLATTAAIATTGPGETSTSDGDLSEQGVGQSGERPITLRPIGVVRRDTGGEHEHGGPATIEIEAGYRDGLTGLGSFSHVLVLWWADRRDNDVDRAVLRVHPRAAPEQETGVFAARSPARPNPVAVSVCPVVAVDEAAGTLRVGLIDAEDGTPVVDLKGYMPAADRVREPRVPAWLTHQSEWASESPHDP